MSNIMNKIKRDILEPKSQMSHCHVFITLLELSTSLFSQPNPIPSPSPFPFSWPQNLRKNMATSTSASLLLHPPLLSRRRSDTTVRLAAVSNRRRSLLLLLSLPAPFLAVSAPPSTAADIGLFGIRKKVEKIEQEVVKEGEELVEKEIKTAEKEIELVEKEIKTAGKEIESAAEAVGVGFQIAGDLVQAGAVAGAEAVGVLVGLSVVNGILGTESQKS